MSRSALVTADDTVDDEAARDDDGELTGGSAEAAPARYASESFASGASPMYLSTISEAQRANAMMIGVSTPSLASSRAPVTRNV